MSDGNGKILAKGKISKNYEGEWKKRIQEQRNDTKTIDGNVDQQTGNSVPAQRDREIAKTAAQRVFGLIVIFGGSWCLQSIGWEFFASVVGSMIGPLAILTGLSMVFGKVK